MADVGLRFARWLIAAVLAASGIWVALSPRADQPVLDGLERAFPAIRSAYMEKPPHAAPATREDEGANREARNQGRERNRWAIAAVFLLLSASLVVSLPRRTSPPVHQD